VHAIAWTYNTVYCGNIHTSFFIFVPMGQQQYVHYWDVDTLLVKPRSGRTFGTLCASFKYFSHTFNVLLFSM